MNNYEADRAMNQKRLRMEGEPGHGVVQGNGLPLNYMDNGHQIPYQPYASAYNTHYPPDAFAAYGAPPPGGYAPQNLSYVPPAHQNYPHHQSFPPQQPQPQLHMPQSHMVQGYGADVGVHKAPAWPPQPHLLPPLDAQKPLDIKQLKPEIKLEPTDTQKRPHPDTEMLVCKNIPEMEQPKIKIKTDIFKPDDPNKIEADRTREMVQKSMDVVQKPVERKEEVQPKVSEGISGDKPTEAGKPDAAADASGDIPRTPDTSKAADKREDDRKPFSSPDVSKSPMTPTKALTPGSEPKKRGRPKGSTNKPKPPGAVTRATTPGAVGGGAVSPGAPRAPVPPRPALLGRPRGAGYQYAVRPFRKDFSGIQFRRRWSDECLDSSHIPNEVYFGDVPVPTEVLHNYYDAHAERERAAAHAAHLAAQKAAAAKLAAARMQARGLVEQVTTVDSSSSEDSSGSSESGSEDSDDDRPLKRGPGRPKGSKNTSPRGGGSGGSSGTGRRGRPPVPPELRQPGITDMKKFCKAAGIRFHYKKLVEGCTKNKERVAKMMELLVNAGLEGKPTIEKCKALNQAKLDKKAQEKLAKKEAKSKTKEDDVEGNSSGAETGGARRMTRGATGVKPRQRIVISSDEEDDTPAARRTLSKLRSSLNDDTDTD